MTIDDFNAQRSDIPDAPGVYFFLGARKTILYIGKATSLRSRVRSYFTDDILEKRSPLIAQMVAEAREIEWTETDSVLEALILETNLIRTHTPKYNTRSKDDKSFNHLVITNEEYPRVLIVRERDLTERFENRELKYVFGPFPSGRLFREALKIVRSIFKFYDTERPIAEMTTRMGRGRIDFNRQIGLYPHEGSRDEYLKTIRHLRLFFEGKKGQIIKELERDMRAHAKRQEFEQAAEAKRKIAALRHIKDVALLRRELFSDRAAAGMRIEAYDVAHLRGEHMVGVMTVVEDGQPQPDAYRKFKIRSVARANDTAALQEVLDRRLGHTEWPMPRIIVVDGGVAQRNAAAAVLKKYGVDIPLVAVTKDEKHRPKHIRGARAVLAGREDDILLANAEAHRFAIAYYRQKQRDIGA